MRLLLDTHILLWASGRPERLPRGARGLLEDPANTLVFSVASIWEMAIKASRRMIEVDVAQLRHDLIDSGHTELAITSRHAIEAGSLPAIHRDPFDRMLIAQARVEDLQLITGDRLVARYPGPIRQV